jgi:hypothetical protein
MRRVLALAFALAAVPASAGPPAVMCGTRSAARTASTTATASRLGSGRRQLHGHDNQGRAWTTEHDGSTYVWPTR